MGSKQHVLTVQILEHDDLLAMQTGCIKDKRNVYAAVFGFRHKYGFSCNFFAVNKQLLTGFFIHENAGRTVLFTGNKTGVRYRIGQRNFIERIDFFFSLNGGLRADFNRHIMKAYRSNPAFAEFYDLRIGESIAKGFLCIEFFHAVLILGFAFVIFEDREGFGQNQAAGIRRVYLAVVVCKARYAELNALNLTIVGSLDDLQLAVLEFI